jgi:hypothetical protein
MAQVQVRMFSSGGDDVLLDYDPTTADMKEVNAFVDKLEKDTGGRAFSMTTGDAVEKVTRDTQDVVIVRPIAGG